MNGKKIWIKFEKNLKQMWKEFVANLKWFRSKFDLNLKQMWGEFEINWKPVSELKRIYKKKELNRGNWSEFFSNLSEFCLKSKQILLKWNLEMTL